MSYQQVKDSFLGEEQRRQKLRLLFIELLVNREYCSAMVIGQEHVQEQYSLVTLDATVLQTLLVDTYPIIINNTEMVRLLLRIRGEIHMMNNENKIFYSKICLPVSNLRNIVTDHNEYINNSVQKLILLLDRSLEILRENYGFVNPF